MDLRFFGAAQTTTGSMHLLTVNGKRVLLDCGLYQGKRKEAFERNRTLPFDPKSLDAVVLSHAHIDHSGNLPTLARLGFEGRVHATPATIDLCEIMLGDSARLQMHDVDYVNKKRAKAGQRAFEPLYTPEDVARLMGLFAPTPYGKAVEVVPGVRVTLHDAGHILGSATVQIDATENGRTERIVFTGDLGRAHLPILRDPETVTGAATLITESTYGGRTHEAMPDVAARLAALVGEVSAKRAKLIIPAFSVGRTQQILYFLNELYEAHRVPEIPVFVDSPLSTKATGIYEAHSECYDAEMIALLRKGDLPFSFRRLNYVTETEQSKALNAAAGPMVIISASGMCEGGRILHHLKHGLGDSRNVVLFVGYQAENTLGRYLVDGRKQVRVFGDDVQVRARIDKLLALSGHADQNELIAWARALGPQLRRAFVVHGELEGNEAIAAALTQLGVPQVTIPAPGQTASL